jgi:hypothetical protein
MDPTPNCLNFAAADLAAARLSVLKVLVEQQVKTDMF